MRFTRREWLAGAAVAIATAPQFKLIAQRSLAVVTPEQFGAVGDGVTNDTAAFAKMAAYVNRRKSGQIVLRPTTYIVGQQTNSKQSIKSTGYAFAPAPILTLDGCTGPISIQGNGARLRCADGLRFGTFNPATGQPTYHQLPYLDDGERASPYQAMILIQNCTGDISIENVELDGNLAGLIVGGKYGDVGWQLPADGLRLVNNAGNELIAQVYTHHHARDGILIIGLAERGTSSSLQAVNSEYNARQGCSLVGGRNYSFSDSKFNHTGRGSIASPPAAGVDLESEFAPIRNISFAGCEFSNNAGVGLIADSGDTEGATFDKCRFVGATAWSAWPNKPLMSFTNCQFVGAVVHPFSDPDPARSAKFFNCEFVDNPALSPTGQVYTPTEAIVNLAVSENVLFDGCRFDLQSELVLPWSWQAIYNNCTMSQVSPVLSHPKGTYTGVCTIDGYAELYGAVIVGKLIANGVSVGGAIIKGELILNGEVIPPNA
jgi:hypothetical protein